MGFSGICRTLRRASIGLAHALRRHPGPAEKPVPDSAENPGGQRRRHDGEIGIVHGFPLFGARLAGRPGWVSGKVVFRQTIR